MPVRRRRAVPASHQVRSDSVGALLVNRLAGRFILRSRSAGSKGCAPTRHDVSPVADSSWYFSAPSKPLPLLLIRLSPCSPLFLRVLCVKSFAFLASCTKSARPTRHLPPRTVRYKAVRPQQFIAANSACLASNSSAQTKMKLAELAEEV